MNNLGEYTLIGKHKGCLYRGLVFHIVSADGKLDYHWCRGNIWDGIEKKWKYCGQSTLKGDNVEVEK